MAINYPTFLKKVDRITSTCNADVLRLFIHAISALNARK